MSKGSSRGLQGNTHRVTARGNHDAPNARVSQSTAGQVSISIQNRSTVDFQKETIGTGRIRIEQTRIKHRIEHSWTSKRSMDISHHGGSGRHTATRSSLSMNLESEKYSEKLKNDRPLQRQKEWMVRKYSADKWQTSLNAFQRTHHRDPDFFQSASLSKIKKRKG